MSAIEIGLPAIPAGELSLRVAEANPNHHLWNNNGTWFLHCTVHRPDFTKERVRTSLRTRCVRKARRRRDSVLQRVGRKKAQEGAREKEE